jgi:hypothetical protein
VTAPSGAPGELVDLLVTAISSVPGDEWTEAATFAAFALGGSPLEFSAAPENRIPNAGTIGAEKFIAGRTMGRERYLALLRSRLVEVIKDGLREDFIVAAVADDISAQFERLTDTEASNESRARLSTAISRYIADPATFRGEMAEQDPSVADLTDDEVKQRLTGMLNRLMPAGDAEVAAHLELKNHWEDARRQYLTAAALDEWRNRSR